MRKMWILVLLLLLAGAPAALAQETPRHEVSVGDTWTALAARYGTTVAALQAANGPWVNPHRQPTIGGSVRLPAGATVEQTGRIERPGFDSVLSAAAAAGVNPWRMAREMDLGSPYRPLFYRPVLLPAPTPPRELPPGFTTLELSHVPARPGEGIAFRGTLQTPVMVEADLNTITGTVVAEEDHVVGLLATGAFYRPGAPELRIATAGAPAWHQPWRMQPGTWGFQELTLTGEAAQIDRASIIAERERLFELWTNVTPVPQWSTPTRLPVDSYVSLSADYGVRRSYNGGPYSSYHEGVDFAAYGGTPVLAPARGTVILAERLYVRGGAVIVDHGLGIYSGFYHLSDVAVASGDVVDPGDVVGAVGTTGLSTGNHLHWDMLVNATWIDAMAWHVDGMNCWVLEGLALPCEPLQ